MQEAYPWLKFGLMYNEFKARKQSMHLAFGFELSDGEAAAQLRYFHASHPDTVAAVGAAPQRAPGRRDAGSGWFRLHRTLIAAHRPR